MPARVPADADDPGDRPGFGRWTHYLQGYCEHLAIVDVSEECIAACRRRFASSSKPTYHVNDGRSLEMLADRSVDLALSFDSLVHAGSDVIHDSLRELASRLTPDAIGFFHHSNVGACRAAFAREARLPGPVRELVSRRGLLGRPHWRAGSTTAQQFHAHCEEVGLQCIGQELVSRGTRWLIDCTSLFTAQGSVWAKPNRVSQSGDFMREAAMIRRMAALYAVRYRRE